MKTAVRALFLAMAMVVAIAMPPRPVQVEAEPADFPVADGHFYSQAGPDPGSGYVISDAGGVLFWQAFQSLGGVQALGYPISRRFTLDGMVAQATQRAILQWDPAAREVLLVNVMDRLHDAGADPALATCCAVPAQFPDSVDIGKSEDQVIAGRLAFLDASPAIREAYFNAEDPLHDYGLPTSAVEDHGTFWVMRLQRSVIQQWKVDVPWAKAGQVTFANVGELANMANLIPQEARRPDTVSLTDGSIQAGAVSVVLTPTVIPAKAAGQSTVKVIAPPTGTGTGFIYSADGLIVTANHVVDGARLLAVLFADGRRLPATLVGADPFSDVALLRVNAANLTAMPLGSSANLGKGDPVTALGYDAASPQAQVAKSGVVTGLASARRPGETAATAFILTDVGLEPGFSGGPLVDGSGRIVGMNTAVLYSSRNPGEKDANLAVAIDAIGSVVRRLQAGTVTQVQTVGFTAADLSDELAASFDLAVSRGALVIRVEPASPAAAAGLSAGDIVIKANDEPVYGSGDLAAVMARTRPGDQVDFQVVGHDGTWRTLTVSTLKSR